MFADQREVKRVVNLLPKVGIGSNYGLPQSRYTTSVRSSVSPTTYTKERFQDSYVDLQLDILFIVMYTLGFF